MTAPENSASVMDFRIHDTLPSNSLTDVEGTTSQHGSLTNAISATPITMTGTVLLGKGLSPGKAEKPLNRGRELKDSFDRTVRHRRISKVVLKTTKQTPGENRPVNNSNKEEPSSRLCSTRPISHSITAKNLQDDAEIFHVTEPSVAPAASVSPSIFFSTEGPERPNSDDANPRSGSTLSVELLSPSHGDNDWQNSKYRIANQRWWKSWKRIIGRNLQSQVLALASFNAWNITRLLSLDMIPYQLWMTAFMREYCPPHTDYLMVVNIELLAKRKTRRANLMGLLQSGDRDLEASAQDLKDFESEVECYRYEAPLGVMPCRTSWRCLIKDNVLHDELDPPSDYLMPALPEEGGRDFEESLRRGRARHIAGLTGISKRPGSRRVHPSDQEFAWRKHDWVYRNYVNTWPDIVDSRPSPGNFGAIGDGRPQRLV